MTTSAGRREGAHDPDQPTGASGYIRVSTARQGRSGLGLEAQRTAISRFAEAEAFNLVETFTETESGVGDDRPQLNAAIERARKAKAPIICAKLDRLSRDVHYISGLMKHRVPFIVKLGRGEFYVAHPPSSNHPLALIYHWGTGAQGHDLF
jgi:hypothetical protein